MTMLLKKFGFPTVAFNAEGGGAGGAGEQPSASSVLFPDDAGEKSDQTPAGDWVEYADDPNKTAEENAAAKVEHDKGKPTDDKKAGPENEVPEDGKYELTMPEGVEVDSELLAAVSPRFKELGLTRAQAQALTDDFIKVQQERSETQVKNWGERVQKWADDAKADKEMGGDNWSASVGNAQLAIAKLGTPELKEYLEASGGGNHPEIIRILSKAGALLKEDSPPSGNGAAAGKVVNPAHVLFPNDVPKGK